MTETRTYCDHCGVELNNMKDYIDICIDDFYSYFDTDLCKDCFMELNNMVRKFCGKDER